MSILLLLWAGSESVVLRVGHVVPVESEPFRDGVIVIREGKIAALGRAGDVEIPDGAEVREFRDGWAFPGFLDLHAHIGGGDLNDSVYPVNPDLRTLDTIEVENDDLRRAVAGGVTTILFIPGSESNMGGMGTLMKTYGRTRDELVLRIPGALKIAQAGNPERSGGDLGYTRCGMNFLLRDVLRRAREYDARWRAYEEGRAGERPERDLWFEQLRPVVRGEIPVAVHTQQFQVVQSTIRILHDEWNLWVVLDHSTFDAYLNAPLVAERGIPAICGPRIYHFDRDAAAFRGVAAEWHARGVRDVGINTDSPVIPQEELITQVAMAIRHGLPEDVTLRGVTIVPARAVGIEQRVGSLAPGKDADVVIWTDWPFDLRQRVHAAYVSGRLAYDEERDGRRF